MMIFLCNVVYRSWVFFRNVVSKNVNLPYRNFVIKQRIYYYGNSLLYKSKFSLENSTYFFLFYKYCCKRMLIFPGNIIPNKFRFSMDSIYQINAVYFLEILYKINADLSTKFFIKEIQVFLLYILLKKCRFSWKVFE